LGNWSCFAWAFLRTKANNVFQSIYQRISERMSGKRGFASRNKETQRAIAAKGGRTAQAKGVARNWNSEEARLTGQKGGKALHKK